MDLANHSYATVQSYLKINLLKKIDQTPCVEIVFDEKHQDVYELFIISNNEYFNNSYNCSITYGDCYYYVLNYNDETFYNELSVLDCGGYYIALCIFKNKLNITKEILYVKDTMKFKMNTFIGTKKMSVKAS